MGKLRDKAVSTMVSEAVSTTRIIDVVFNEEEGTLTVTGSPETLVTPEAWLWNFGQLPEGYRPAIVFSGATNFGQGPFCALRLERHETGDRIWGEGNIGEDTGNEGPWEYMALVLNETGTQVMAQSDSISMTNEGPRVTTPVVEVRLNLENNTFVADPEVLTLYPNSTVTFHFVDLPQNSSPLVRFDGVQEEEGGGWEPCPSWGPFQSVAACGDRVLCNDYHDESELTAKRRMYRYWVNVFQLDAGGISERRFSRPRDPFVAIEEDPIGNTNTNNAQEEVEG